MPKLSLHRFLVAALVLAAPACVAAPEADESNAVQASLLSAQSALVPGTTVWLGVSLRHAPHWHTYWRNPGDSGQPTRARFTLPAGYSVDDIAWPAPTRIAVDGLYNFGYEGDALLPVALHVPADAVPGSSAALRADVSWLMCREQCVPGKASLALTLPVRASAPAADATTTARFALARASLPGDATWSAQARHVDKAIVVTLHGENLPPAYGLDAFVAERKTVDHAPPQITAHDDTLELRFAQSDYFTTLPPTLTLVLVQNAGTEKQAWQITAPTAGP